MKFPIIGILSLLCLCLGLTAQTPQSFQYQAVVRNTQGLPLPNRSVRFQLMIQQGQSGPLVYQEQHSATTSAQGLVALEVGRGTLINSSGPFTAINWANAPFFLNLHFDSTGTGSFISMGSVELLSVPYALYSGKSGIADSARVSGNGMPNGTVAGQILYWNGSAWVTVPAGTEGKLLTYCSGVPTWRTGGTCPAALRVGTVNCQIIPTQVDDVINSITGRTWMDRNLGAAQVATSSSDANSYGDLYQWGRFSDGHQCRNSTSTTTLSTTDTPGHGNFISTGTNDWRTPANDNLWQGVNGINNPCPIGYRLPTGTEWASEIQSWTSLNSAGAFASPLKLTLGGVRLSTITANQGVSGEYWSSTTGPSSNALILSFNSSSASFGNNTVRSSARSVRCIKN